MLSGRSAVVWRGKSQCRCRREKITQDRGSSLNQVGRIVNRYQTDMLRVSLKPGISRDRLANGTIF